MNIEEIHRYVDSKINWSASTKNTARSKLTTLLNTGFDPYKCYSYLDSQKYSRYSIKTYFILASGLDKSFSQFLKDNSALFRNAYKDKVTQVKIEQVKELLLESAKLNKNLYNLLYLMAFAGLRYTEAQTSKWSDIKENSYLELVGKGNKFRQVPINLSKLFPPSSPEATLIAGNVNPRQFLAKYDITPHGLRAFYITHVLRNKILDLDEVQKIVGHSSLITTQRYIRFDLKNASQKLKDAGL